MGWILVARRAKDENRPSPQATAEITQRRDGFVGAWPVRPPARSMLPPEPRIADGLTERNPRFGTRQDDHEPQGTRTRCPRRRRPLPEGPRLYRARRGLPRNGKAGSQGLGGLASRTGSVLGAGYPRQPQPDQRRGPGRARRRPPWEPQAELDGVRQVGQGSANATSLHEIRRSAPGARLGHAPCPYPTPVRRGQRDRYVRDGHPSPGSG
jgi:hypothetical protein